MELNTSFELVKTFTVIEEYPGMSSKTKTSPQKRKPPANRNPPPDIPDVIPDLIGKIRTDEFVDGVDQLLRDNLENFGQASDSWITDKKKYYKLPRNDVAVDYFKWYINLMKDLCSSISLLRTESYDLKEVTVNNYPAIIKAKMLFT
ncbi:hypothetical protein AVEN_153625-1 [Araneus ventricosus]|uniref:Uncharacterized protein n=1 Tax=Araneus ventricosus TaxID=182803 RepID=A0A4Y2BRP3_ARAVE|nr:hypothetical protein AVEN_153625-1 [Araneus ventricosus]